MHVGYCKCRVDGKKDWDADGSGAFEVGVLGEGFNELRELLADINRGKQLVEIQLASIICPLEVNIQISSFKNFNS